MTNQAVAVLFLLCASASAQGHLHKVGVEYIECKRANCACTRYAVDYRTATGCVWGAEVGDTVAEVQAAYRRALQTQTRLSGLVGGTTGALWENASPIYCISYQQSGVADGIESTQASREVQSLSRKMTDAIEERLGMLKLTSWEQYQREVKKAMQATSRPAGSTIQEYLQLVLDTQERLARLNGFVTNPWTYLGIASAPLQSVSADVNGVQHRWTQLSPEDQRILGGHADALRVTVP